VYKGRFVEFVCDFQQLEILTGSLQLIFVCFQLLSTVELFYSGDNLWQLIVFIGLLSDN
jgi:hypothetical protein